MVFVAVAYMVWQEEPVQEVSCPARLAGIDLGSGSTKLLIADVDPCGHDLHRVILRESTKVDYKHDLSFNGGSFSEEIRARGVQVLKDYLELIQKLGAQEPTVLATEAFRQSHNAADFLEQMHTELGLTPQIVDQGLEATLSFYSALASTGVPREDAVVWDIGGASQQISFWGSHGLESRLIPWGSISFKEKVSEALGKKGLSPNPFSWPEVTQAQQLVRTRAEFPRAGKTVLGVGGVFQKSLLSRLEASPIHRIDLEDLLARTYFYTDEQLQSLYPETDTTNLIMVLTLMGHYELSEVSVASSGLLEAALVFPELLTGDLSH